MTYSYNSDWTLASKTDNAGNVISYTWDTQKRVLTESWNQNTAYTYTWDTGSNGMGRLATVAFNVFSGATKNSYANQAATLTQSWGYTPAGDVATRRLQASRRKSACLARLRPIDVSPAMVKVYFAFFFVLLQVFSWPQKTGEQKTAHDANNETLTFVVGGGARTENPARAAAKARAAIWQHWITKQAATVRIRFVTKEGQVTACTYSMSSQVPVAVSCSSSSVFGPGEGTATALRRVDAVTRETVPMSRHTDPKMFRLQFFDAVGQLIGTV